jgi:hypothetical protein
MNFFSSLKTQHLVLLTSLPTTGVYRKLCYILLLIIVASSTVLFGVFGNDLFQTITTMFETETEMSFPIEPSMMPWVYVALAGMTVIFELLWIATVAWITRRVLIYAKTPLSFIHVFNIYVLIRLYEMAVEFAILLGMAVSALATGTSSLPGLTDAASTRSGLSSIVSLIIPVFFFWLYIWSIRKVAASDSNNTKAV